MSTTVVSVDQDLEKYARNQEQQLLDDLIKEEKQNQKNTHESQQEKQFRQKYEKFLTFKTYGKGAFGEVTEIFDPINRKTYAKKQFQELKDYNTEKQATFEIKKYMDSKSLSKLIAPVYKYDVQNLSIYYETGICSLHDLINICRERQYCFFEDKEPQLYYIIARFFRIALKLYSKSIYHSDIKPMNAVLFEEKSGQYGIKFIDLGGTDFSHTYLTAITELYFPDVHTYNYSESKEKRFFAEIYQIGRVIQEICLSSIYSKQQIFYEKCSEYKSYKQFKSFYFEHTQEKIKTSINLISKYYSKNITQILKDILYLKQTDPQLIQKKIQILKQKADKNLSGVLHHFIQDIKQNKITEQFLKMRQGENDQEKDVDPEEMEFYLEFDLEEKGAQKCQQLIDQIEDFGVYKTWNKYPYISIYAPIFYTRLQKHGTSVEFQSERYREANIEQEYIENLQEFFKINNTKLTKNQKLLFFKELYVHNIVSESQTIDPETSKKVADILQIDYKNDPYHKTLIEIIENKEDIMIQKEQYFSTESLQTQIDSLQSLIKSDPQNKTTYLQDQLSLQFQFLMAIKQLTFSKKSDLQKIYEIIQNCETLIQNLYLNKINKKYAYLILIKASIKYYSEIPKDPEALKQFYIDVLQLYLLAQKLIERTNFDLQKNEDYKLLLYNISHLYEQLKDHENNEIYAKICTAFNMIPVISDPQFKKNEHYAIDYVRKNFYNTIPDFSFKQPHIFTIITYFLSIPIYLLNSRNDLASINPPIFLKQMEIENDEYFLLAGSQEGNTLISHEDFRETSIDNFFAYIKNKTGTDLENCFDYDENGNKIDAPKLTQVFPFKVKMKILQTYFEISKNQAKTIRFLKVIENYHKQNQIEQNDIILFRMHLYVNDNEVGFNKQAEQLKDLTTIQQQSLNILKSNLDITEQSLQSSMLSQNSLQVSNLKDSLRTIETNSQFSHIRPLNQSKLSLKQSFRKKSSIQQHIQDHNSKTDRISQSTISIPQSSKFQQQQTQNQKKRSESQKKVTKFDPMMENSNLQNSMYSNKPTNLEQLMINRLNNFDYVNNFNYMNNNSQKYEQEQNNVQIPNNLLSQLNYPVPQKSRQQEIIENMQQKIQQLEKQLVDHQNQKYNNINQQNQQKIDNMKKYTKSKTIQPKQNLQKKQSHCALDDLKQFYQDEQTHNKFRQFYKEISSINNQQQQQRNQYI